MAADVSGMIQSSHHCGKIKSLNTSVPSRALRSMIMVATMPVTSEISMIVSSTPHSTHLAAPGSTRDMTMSTRICSLVRKRCGATKNVEMKRAYSVSSISPMMDGKPNIRRMTSALMPSIIAAIKAIARMHSARTSQPFSRNTMRMLIAPLACAALSSRTCVLAGSLLREQRLYLADRFRTELLQVVPIEIDGDFLELRAEADDLDALLLLQVERSLRRLVGIAHTVSFEPGHRIVDHLALRGGERIVLGLVHQDVDDYVVEGGIDPHLGELVPAEIVDAPQGPAVALRAAGLERRVDFGRRDVHAGDAVILEDRVVVRLATKPQTLEVFRLRERHLLGDIEVEGNAHAVGRKIKGIHPLDRNLVQHRIGAGLALLRDAHMGKDLRIAFDHGALVVGRRDRGDVEHARFHRLGLAVGRHRFRTADDADLQDALAGLGHVVDDTVER